mmetsp:Transcript_64828/g.163298  ORF Transcript_64828/g.163298 Transcript_64828/m.163298 type:complete len:208 (-) Transcript_64828:3715-4338(-)
MPPPAPRRVEAPLPLAPPGELPSPRSGADSARAMPAPAPPPVRAPAASASDSSRVLTLSLALMAIMAAACSLLLRNSERFSFRSMFISAMSAAFSPVSRRRTAPPSRLICVEDAASIMFLRNSRSRCMTISFIIIWSLVGSSGPLRIASSSLGGFHWLNFWYFSSTAMSRLGIRSNSAALSAWRICSTSFSMRRPSFFNCINCRERC